MVLIRSACGSVVAVAMVTMVTMVASKAVVHRKFGSDVCASITKLSTTQRNNCNAISLRMAAATGDDRRIQDLLQERDVSYLLAYTENQGRRKGYTALFWAAEKNHTSAVEILVEAGSDVNHTSNARYTVVYLLAENGALTPLRLVLEKNAISDVKTRRGLTPLLIAAWNGYAEVVHLLLAQGADPNTSTPDTLYSPLYLAAKAGNAEIVRALLNAGADPNKKNSWNVTSLLAAAQWEREPVVPLLLQFGADPNVREKDGYTALHKAVYYRQLGIVEALLEGGAKLDLQDRWGRTPLHYCVMTKSNEVVTDRTGPEARQRVTELEITKLEMLKKLLSRCPDAQIRNKSGKTALDLTKTGNSSQLQEALQGYTRSSC